MGDITQLKASILEKTHEKGRKLLAEAQASIEQERQQNEELLQQEKLRQREQRLKEIRLWFQRERQQIEHKKRQSTLVTKQRVLTELFSDVEKQMHSWSAVEELAFLEKVLEKYTDEPLHLIFGEVTAAKFTPDQLQQLQVKHPQLVIEQTRVTHQAGFILSQGKIDHNYLYSQLVEAVWQTEGYRVAQEIFADTLE